MSFSIKIVRIALLIVLISTYSAFAEKRQLTLKDLQGSWYKSSFLDVLQKTKSVHRAVFGVHFVAFEITGDRQFERYNWLLIYNFHEGINRQLTGISIVDDHTYSLVCTDCYENTHFKLLSTDVLCFSQGPEFKRIHNFASYVNEMTVSGVYVNDQGQIYFFYKNGLSLWPDDKFYYEVGLDQVFYPADYIKIKNRKDESGYPLIYFFKATETSLELFEAVYEEDGIPVQAKELILKLSRYEKEFCHYLDDGRFQHLEAQSKEQLKLLRNEIFARHRHSFDSSDMRSYFNNQPWYHEYKDHKVSIDELSEAELKVLKKIQNLEKNEK